MPKVIPPEYILLTGQTFPVKDQLKDLGCIFGEQPGGSKGWYVSPDLLQEAQSIIQNQGKKPASKSANRELPKEEPPVSPQPLSTDPVSPQPASTHPVGKPVKSPAPASRPKPISQPAEQPPPAELEQSTEKKQGVVLEEDSLSGQPAAVHLEEDSLSGRAQPVHLEEDSRHDGRAKPARSPEVDSLSGRAQPVHLGVDSLSGQPAAVHLPEPAQPHLREVPPTAAIQPPSPKSEEPENLQVPAEVKAPTSPSTKSKKTYKAPNYETNPFAVREYLYLWLTTNMELLITQIVASTHQEAQEKGEAYALRYNQGHEKIIPLTLIPTAELPLDPHTKEPLEVVVIDTPPTRD